MKLHERFLDETPDPEQRRLKHDATVRLFCMVESGACRHRAILHHFDEAMDA